MLNQPARELGLLWDSSESYSWHGSTLDYHLAQIHQHIGWLGDRCIDFHPFKAVVGQDD